jgi:Zn finger protein HypA/HybF involved in hydrogenase expression
MGWNDHVDYAETECLDCGVTDTWQYWDVVGKSRYVGAIGEMVGQDATKSDQCPHCGSTRGRIVEDDEDDWPDD